MSVPIRYILAAIAFAIAVLGFVLLPTGAHADDCHACQPPPPCHCEPPPPPSCNNACSHSESHAEAHASAFSVNVARASTPDVVIHHGSASAESDASIHIGVESSFFGRGASHLIAGRATDTLRAVCIDAEGAERMASQTFAEANVPDDYQGEIYRCAAGLHMRATLRGESFDCAEAEALWYSAGQLTCRAQAARARGYEQALIARFGYADKIAIFSAPGQAQAAFAQSAAPGGVGASW